MTLKAEPINAKVGDAVTFNAQSNILSNKPDFEATRYFKYDFDGDGEVDLTTKKDTVEFAFSEPGEYYPKVQVYYRGRAGVGGSERIFVQK
ncbi:MAG: hypothetical protein H6765_04825 [Candidatus Peribacteria bacterium]|nr:MAG: hypothetical protein H6765_04825 [Candidatus Peribacteria bacterium]